MPVNGVRAGYAAALLLQPLPNRNVPFEPSVKSPWYSVPKSLPRKLVWVGGERVVIDQPAVAHAERRHRVVQPPVERGKRQPRESVDQRPRLLALGVGVAALVEARLLPVSVHPEIELHPAARVDRAVEVSGELVGAVRLGAIAIALPREPGGVEPRPATGEADRARAAARRKGSCAPFCSCRPRPSPRSAAAPPWRPSA